MRLTQLVKFTKLHIISCISFPSQRHISYCSANMSSLSTSESENGSVSSNIIKTSNSDTISHCVTLLERGGVLAVPTDTIYGLAASALDSQAIDKIYTMKGRTKMKPLAVCVGRCEDIDKWAVNTVSNDLLNELLPGPVTLVFERRSTLNPSLNPQSKTVGLRIPDSPFIVELAQSFGNPLALTSANVSNEQSTLAVEEFQSLWPKLDAVVDGGRIGDVKASREGSTVVDLSVPGSYRIIRPGCALAQTSSLLLKYGLQEISSS